MGEDTNKKVAKWYFGGVASAFTVMVTHPLDTIKVHLQTSADKNASMLKITKHIVHTSGFPGLYKGIDASIMRQLTYSTTRFALYDILKAMAAGPDTGFGMKVLIAAVCGAAGGFVGTPADLVNVRMQNDTKLPPDKRRGYKNVFHGFFRVIKDEGITRMFGGGGLTAFRAALMTVGQLSLYDQAKVIMIKSGYFNDNIHTHFLASFIAGACATALTQPIDVIKTKRMNAKPGEFKNTTAIVMSTAKMGPLAFFKGFIPAFVRIGPNTIMAFLLLEQFRIHFGVYPKSKS